jgi:hypothetical protein
MITHRFASAIGASRHDRRRPPMGWTGREGDRHMPQRVQMTRSRPWRPDHPDAIIVARPTIWGNPWAAGAPARFWLPEWPVSQQPIAGDLTPFDVVTLFDRLLTGWHTSDPPKTLLPANLNSKGITHARRLLRDHAAIILRRLPELRGRNLACWCPLDAPCHADVLLRLANEETDQ